MVQRLAGAAPTRSSSLNLDENEMNMWIRFAILLMACVTGGLLAGCDEQKVADTVNAIKPDAMAFGNLQPGVSTIDDVRRQAGKPEIVWQNDDGSQRFEYPRGPNGTKTYMVEFAPDGTMVAITQALTAENFAKVGPGMTKDDVRRLLGKPATVARYALKQEDVWSWHWAAGGYPGDSMFDAHFSVDGVVTTTSRSEAPGHEKP
ncbi:hypothetical protein GGD69_006092 [Paraburkholderia fungorum]|jgi:hypothetical protein|uniref:Outer membrane protein assembly factor BamE domain-containing protein n=4 Tax=Paraburkholderia fungorum TaxID=134537 RepID=A0AAW3V2U6_9BURK|nr:outer membrane protein assembly factor BamE [Paraburkholderia fungorum]MBB6205198.1 hypothetical protein [Paraburkholderia fungorum]